MALLAYGVNHTTAPAALREQLAFGPDQLGSALKALRAHPGVREAAILSTCNRTDLYCGIQTASGSAPQPSQVEAVTNWIGEYQGIRSSEILRHFYRHHAASAVRHVMRVASGLDSMVLGEPQILGQLKSAYRSAMDHGTLGTVLGQLFQQAFSVAKRVRTDTAIGECPVSIAFAAASLSRRVFGDLSKSTALLVGAGETIELTARHLVRHGLRRIIIANRTLTNAQRLAVKFGGHAIALESLSAYLAEADIVVSSTASPAPLITVEHARYATAARRGRPIFMVDLAIPLDIEPEVGTLEDIYLYTVDDLRDVIKDNLETRRAAATRAEEIVDSQVDTFMGWLGTRDVSDTIRGVRGNAERLRDEVHAKAMRLLERGRDPEEVVEYLARTLTNKLMHEPTRAIRQAGAASREDTVAAARLLYGLPPSMNRGGRSLVGRDLPRST